MCGKIAQTETDVVSLNAASHQIMSVLSGWALSIEQRWAFWALNKDEHWALSIDEHWWALSIEQRWALRFEHWWALSIEQRWALSIEQRWALSIEQNAKVGAQPSSQAQLSTKVIWKPTKSGENNPAFTLVWNAWQWKKSWAGSKRVLSSWQTKKSWQPACCKATNHKKGSNWASPLEIRSNKEACSWNRGE